VETRSPNGSLARTAGLAVALALALAVVAPQPACGYQAVYAQPAARLHVKLVRTLIPDVVAADEVTAGLREELARRGALQGGDGYPRVEIEVLEADETSEGIAEAPGPAGSTGSEPGSGPRRPTRPGARATDVAIAARAWVIIAPGAAPESDTGDVRAEETIGVDMAADGPDPRAAGFHEADALRAAARRLGRRLAYKVTGEPAASDEGSEGR
jgi:hypothetical protein